jgi:hypothetical protein
MKVALSYTVAFAIVLAAAVLPMATRIGAQDAPPLPPEELLQQPRVPIKLYSYDMGSPPGAAARTPRLQMLGMQAGFLINPLGLDSDDDLPPGFSDAGSRPGAGEPDIVQLNIGTYNPYFDLRLKGDPGSVGYYKVHSQLQLLDAGTTSFCVNLQAYTPAGFEVGGVANGPTYLVPTIAMFQDLGNGAGLHTYVGQSIQASSGWTDRINGNFQYGMAVHYPVPGTNATSEQGLFLFLEALGRYRYDTTQPGARPALWEFVPGMQMRISTNCWMNVAASRYNFLSASWKY